MIKLYQFPPCWKELPNASPFCLKVETYLRMAKLPYETVSVRNPRIAPKGKLPFIEDNGKKIPDSTFIIDYLKQTYGDPLDAHLTTKQQADAQALQCLLEDHLGWLIVYYRWAYPAGWMSVKNDFFAGLPALLKAIIPNMIRRQMIKTLYRQGTGRFSEEEIYALGKKDLQSLATILGDRPYFLGEQLSSIDACAYGFLANIIEQPVAIPLQELAHNHANLIEYCQRIRKQFYP